MQGLQNLVVKMILSRNIKGHKGILLLEVSVIAGIVHSYKEKNIVNKKGA